MFKYISLRDKFNHRLFYSCIPPLDKEFGIDNVFLLNEDATDIVYLLGQNKNLDVASKEKKQYDNIVCNSQHIKIGLKINKIHFGGFACWGDNCEVIKIIFEDGTESWFEATFIDWSYPFDPCYKNNSLIKENLIKDLCVFLSSGEQKRLVYFHDCICKINEEKIIREIVLPDNMFIHIFAIAVEY